VVAFTLCENASHISAGSYVGQVLVEGPDGVQSATVAITLNAKNSVWFNRALGAALLLAFLILSLRGAQALYKPKKVGFFRALWRTWKDPFGFWIPTIVALGAAGVAAYQVYDGNPSWGADTGASVIALISTSFAAAGVGTFLSSIKSGEGSNGAAAEGNG
jgi:hypothetical protein